MTPATTFAGRKVALFGLGGSGLVTAQALAAGGAEVVAFDDSEAARAKAQSAGIAVADLRSADWRAFAALVLAPGVPLTHPKPHWTVDLAKAAGVEIVGDIELFCRERAARAPDAPFIAITGTNGKSTTTALTAHILREAGRDVQLGGNIGTAILALEPPSPDRRRKGDAAQPVSVRRSLADGICAEGSRIVARFGGRSRELADVAAARALRGLHNLQNAAFACASADALGIAPTDIARGLASFPGLAHRMEEVARYGRAIIINDSKATNADATEKALASFDDIFWIVGGRPKEGGIAPLAPFFPRVRKAYLIGESSDAFAATLDGRVPYERSGTLDVALAHAAREAAASDAREPVVLLSPACASYDQFPNFEVRGNRFREMARQLAKGAVA